MPEPVRPRKLAAGCAICGKPAVEAHQPFCSARCRDIDLARWLGGTYRVPGDPAPLAGDEPED